MINTNSICRRKRLDFLGEEQGLYYIVISINETFSYLFLKTMKMMLLVFFINRTANVLTFASCCVLPSEMFAIEIFCPSSIIIPIWILSLECLYFMNTPFTGFESSPINKNIIKFYLNVLRNSVARAGH